MILSHWPFFVNLEKIMSDQQMMFALVLAGAFLWGVYLTVQKYALSEKKTPESVMIVGTMLGASIFSFVAELLWSGTIRVTSDFWQPFAITAFLNVVMAQLMIRALATEDASVVAPLSSATPVFAILSAWLILGEYPTAFGYAGIAVAALGAYVLALKGKEIGLSRFVRHVLPRRYHRSVAVVLGPILRITSSRGAQFALLAAYLGAFALSFDKLATVASSPMVFTGAVFLVVAVVTAVIRKPEGGWRNVPPRVFGGMLALGLTSGLFTALMNAGYLYGLTAYVGALKRTMILWVVILAVLFLKEKYGGIRIAGSAIILAGIVLIAF